MAKGNAVWGIDIGQCAFKALRCTVDPKTNLLVAEAFDYIEYPKILSQPDADPAALVRDALKQFLSRNAVRGDRVAISVAGQQGLARFIKLPPVEAKKIPDIVKYEAKQQIPFALEDVIWDYQTLLGGGDSDGMAIETEVGLFAMKRDQVFRAIRPFDDADIELDVIQLTPICVYNAVVHGVLDALPPVEEYDPDHPPESVVVLSMGTETTDLVVTNGYRVWQRSIPLGGNHFTKQLMKELKLTFAKAEHLKRNSREADDPKRIFQAMRPVFNDMVTEVQRSIGYFQSIDRQAKISHVVGMGNAFRLPGLEPYLEKNLGYKVNVVDSFDKLTGPQVVSAPAFKDNVLSFGVCYGLALQGLGLAKLKTNLVPRELVRARMIREKKPWALAAVSLLIAGLGLSFLFHWHRWSRVDPELYTEQVREVGLVSQESQKWLSQDQKDKETFAYLKAIGDQVIGDAERRFLMLELMKAINDALPREADLPPGKVSQLPFEDRPSLHIEYIESQYFGGEGKDLSTWLTPEVQERYQESLRVASGRVGAATTVNAVGSQDIVTTQEVTDGSTSAAGEPLADASVQTPTDAADPTDAATDAGAAAVTDTADAAPPLPPPVDVTDDAGEGADEEAVADVQDEAGEDTLAGESGWVIELHGYHYHNRPEAAPNWGAQYVRNTLIRNLLVGEVELPAGPGKPPMLFAMKELGISHPILAYDGQIKLSDILNPDYEPPDVMDAYSNEFDPLAQQPKGIPGIHKLEEKKKDPKTLERTIKVRTHRFTVQFVWRPKRASTRLEERRLEQPEVNQLNSQVAGGGL